MAMAGSSQDRGEHCPAEKGAYLEGKGRRCQAIAALLSLMDEEAQTALEPAF